MTRVGAPDAPAEQIIQRVPRKAEGIVTRKKKGRGSTAAQEIVPAADRVGPLVHQTADRVEPAMRQAADRVGPLVHDATDRVSPLVHDAADRVGPLVHDAADRVGPLAQQAADRVAPFAQSTAERVQPYAEQAATKVAPYARQAADRVGPYAQDAAERVGPYAQEAKRRGAGYAAQAVDALTPRIDDAMARVSPAVEDVRGRLESDVLPKMSDRLHEAATSDAVTTNAEKRAGKTRGNKPGNQLAVAGDKPKTKRRWLVRAGIVAAAGAAAALAARKLLGGGRDIQEDWEATPTTPYASTTITEPAAAKQERTTAETKPTSAATAPEPEEALADGETTSTGEGADYGEGSYVGTEPPSGYTIKGNRRSMKYHLPDSTGYERTNADVWFESEETAQKAGFSRAQH